MSALIVPIVFAVAHLSLGGHIQSIPNKTFDTNLYLLLARNNIERNIAIAPFSIRTALGVTYLGARGQTAEELAQVLSLPSNDTIEIGDHFSDLLGVTTGSVTLTVANNIFLNTGYTLRPSFNEFALKYFDTDVEIVNFAQQQQAVDDINSWVSEKTNNRIQEIIEQESVDQRTAAIIANAVYFEGALEQVFTRVSRRTFHAIQGNLIDVDAMSVTGRFLYADLPELDAKAVQIPYMDSDLFLVVILPNQRYGLSDLVQRIGSVNFVIRFSMEDVQIVLPTFRIEYEAELKQVLKQLGIRSIFGNSANLNGLVHSGPPVKISDIRHKTIIEVGKRETESAAATSVKTYSYSVRAGQKFFNANHPFVFAIRNLKGVYFIGQVVEV